MTDTRDAREHLAQWRDDCRACSGLRMCAMHRKASRTLSRRGPDAYRAFVREESGNDIARMGDDIAERIAEAARERVDVAHGLDAYGDE